MVTDLITWFTVVMAVVGGSMGFMVWVYRRPLENRALFLEPVTTLSMPLSSTARQTFEAGCRAFQSGQFSSAIKTFMKVSKAEPTCGEAYQNYGLAQANLGIDDLAAKALVKASDIYAQQGNRVGLELVKQQLERLAERRQRLSQSASGQ
jgi:hypothetical protein